MKSSSFYLLVVTVVVAFSATSALDVSHAPAPFRVPNSFLGVFREGIAQDAVSDFFQTIGSILSQLLGKPNNGKPDGKPDGKSKGDDQYQKYFNTFSIGNVRGFTADNLPQSVLSTILKDSRIAYVEGNAVYNATRDPYRECFYEQDLSPDNSQWGLDRISTPVSNPSDWRTLDDEFRVAAPSGYGVDIYVLDTGIRYTHTEFKLYAPFILKKAKNANANEERQIANSQEGEMPFRTGPILANFARDNKNFDCNGHGTAVASLAAGSFSGVAKFANVFGVKILDCNGVGNLISVIQGLQFTRGYAQNRIGRAVVVLAGYTSRSPLLNLVVKELASEGITVVTSAGNRAEDACKYSPASSADSQYLADVIVAGATSYYGGDILDKKRGGEIYDIRWSGSNFGSCVSIFAPGEDVWAADIDDDNDFDSWTGSSMAAGYTAGAAALVLAEHYDYSPSQVKGALQADAFTGLIDMECDDHDDTVAENLRYRNCEKSNNFLLRTPDCAGGPPPPPP